MDTNFPQNQSGQPSGKPTVWEANPRLKTLLLVLIFVFLASGFFLIILMQAQNQYRQKIYTDTQNALLKIRSQQASLKSFSGRAVPVQFQYPAELAVTEASSSVTVNHQVPFENHGPCDMKGDPNTYPTLSDFNVNIQVLDGTVSQAVRQLSPYMPAENFSGNTLKLSPGFIDAAKIGSFTGFAIYEGAEGCGHTIYYFPIDGNRVLVVTKDMVQQFSDVIASTTKAALLKVPGVITPGLSDTIFKEIIESLQVSSASSSASASAATVPDIAGWQTYKNDQYGFEFQYPVDSANNTLVSDTSPNSYDQSVMQVRESGLLDGRPDVTLFSVTVYNSSMDNLIANITKSYGGVSLNIQDTTIQGNAAKVIGYHQGNGQFTVGIYIAKGNYIYGIAGPESNTVLSTFKFTK